MPEDGAAKDVFVDVLRRKRKQPQSHAEMIAWLPISMS